MESDRNTADVLRDRRRLLKALRDCQMVMLQALTEHDEGRADRCALLLRRELRRAGVIGE
jgi:hypothetical protein